MASTVKHLRSSTAAKRPTASGLSDGQLGINTASGTPGVFFKDSAGTVTKVGPAHVGSAAPNATPAGSAGNSLGELWVNNSTTINGLNYFTGSVFVNLTPSGTTTVAGLVELATDAETQTGTDTVRAVTPFGLQSKVSNSISTTSSTTIASATAVKTAYDLANAALPKSGGRVTGGLEIGPAGSLVFEGSTDDGFETTIAVVNPTADRTVTFPDVTGTVVTTGDTGSITSTMIFDGTIVNADINNSAAIDLSKLATGALPSGITVNSANIVDATIVNTDISNSAGIVYSKLALSSGIVNTDISASAAIAGTKISPNFGSQTITTTGVISPALGTAALPSIAFAGDPNTGIYSPGADQVAISTNGTQRLTVDTAATTSTLPVVHPLGAGGTPSITFTGDLNTGLWSPSADALAASTAGSERARIDSSGRLLVGTSSAVAVNNITAGIELHSLVTTNGASASIARFAADAGGPQLNLGKSRSGTLSPGGIVQNNDDLGEISFCGDDGTDITSPAARIACEVDGTPGANDMPGRLVFSTTADGAASPTERLRIDSAGDVGIGKAAEAGKVEIRAINFANNQSANGLWLTGVASTLAAGGAWKAGLLLESDSGGTSSVSIYSPGVTTAGAQTVQKSIEIRGAAASQETRFYTGNTEKMRITSNGRVGLGTSSPATLLHISSATGSATPTPTELRIETTTSASDWSTTDPWGRLSFYSADVSGGGPKIHAAIDVIANDTAAQGGVLDFKVSSNSATLNSLLSISSNGTTTLKALTGTAPFIATINASEVFRIDEVGNVGIGTGSPLSRLHVDGLTRLHSTVTPVTTTTSAIASTLATANTGDVSFESVAVSTATRHHISFVNPNGVVGSITTSASATAYVTSSDYRLKENVVLLTGAIDRLQQIPVHRFNFIADPDTVVDGFIAHEAQEVVPEAVAGAKDAVDADGNPVYQGIDQSKLVPLLTAALQEAITKIEDLEGRLTAAGID